MYEWLETEISQIKKRDFHVVDPTRAMELDRLPDDIRQKLPPSYVTFVSKFGQAKLYRMGEFYQVGVLSLPQSQTEEGRELLRIGHFDDAPSFFELSLLSPGREAPVFELDDELEKIDESFEAWLMKRCADARASYKPEAWQESMKGAEPFSPEEAAILEARRKYHWQVAGVDEEGNLKIKIRNDSNMALPYLTLGVRAKDNSLQGRLWLDVSRIRPGTEGTVIDPAYKKLVLSENLEVYQLPNPTPEERADYWEFKR
jgi:hypothetical protein